MKKLNTLNTLSAVYVAVAMFTGCATSAPKTSVHGPQFWIGTGAVFAQDGTTQHQYKVELTRNPMSDGEVDQQIKILIPKQEPILMSQHLKIDKKGFKIASDSGNGGGLDLGEGFFTTYTTNEQGVTFASSIFMDDDQMRILRYEMKNGKAVRFFRESYIRQ